MHCTIDRRSLTFLQTGQLRFEACATGVGELRDLGLLHLDQLTVRIVHGEHLKPLGVHVVAALLLLSRCVRRFARLGAGLHRVAVIVEHQLLVLVAALAWLRLVRIVVLFLVVVFAVPVFGFAAAVERAFLGV